MENLYDRNNLIFWTQEEIKLRKMFEDHITSQIENALKIENRGFEFIQCEAPILTPNEMINPNYTDEDVFRTSNDLTLRPETTMGSYLYATHLLNKHNERKVKLPLVVWQHGKSFRNEQDQVTKNMRLKEFYQLEFQIIYSNTTMNDYSINLIPKVEQILSNLIGVCHTEDSDRLPSYSEQTIDIVCTRNNMEVCSISKRKDFEDKKVLEIAIGTDRLIYNFQNKNEIF
jgi:glycyl-tRNA synthetase